MLNNNFFLCFTVHELRVKLHLTGFQVFRTTTKEERLVQYIDLGSGAQKGKEPFLFPESFPFSRKGKGKLSIFPGLERKGKGKVLFKRN